MQTKITAEKAIEKLLEGNRRFLKEKQLGNFSPEIRRRLFEEGQSPYAVIVACSDSRVVPEAIFDAGLGELFTVRVAGNVVGMPQLASIEYAVSHLGCPLVVVLGHMGCGAVAAALEGGAHGLISALTDEILRAIAPTDLPEVACRKNARFVAEAIGEALSKEGGPVRVVAAVYDIREGSVELL